MLGTRQILARADAAQRIPQLGGMARPNGIVIVSERYWAFAGVDGSLREGVMAARPPLLRKVPLVRGLVRLAAALSPVFRRRGVTRPRERALLAFALVAPFGFFVLPETVRLPAGIALTVGLVFWITAWAFGIKAFDAFLVTLALVVGAAAVRLFRPFLDQFLGRETAAPDQQGIERV